MQAMEASDPLVQTLRQSAAAAAERAYCPYSRFPVGAAVLTADGSIFAGGNVENASYGLTNCAERSAIFAAVSSGHRRILAVAVYTPTAVATPPCGACRQVINEFGADAWVFSFAREGEPLRYRVSELLPGAFGPGNLAERG